MKELVFATNNRNKLREAAEILPEDILLLNLDDIGCSHEIDETEDTLEGNALLKAKYIAREYKTDCFADDTGLEVTALNMAPGVRSARYAGEPSDPAANIRLLLENMEGLPDRSARFRTVIALIMEGREMLFEGIIEGRITTKARGERGFGYDPVFVPYGYDDTFAEMSASEKNKISHRAIALQKMADFLSREAGAK